MSIVRDPEKYEKFDQLILVHGVRQFDELAFVIERAFVET